MPGDAVAVDKGDEVRGREATEGGFGEMWIGRNEAVGGCLPVREVATAAAGDEDLGAGLGIMLKQEDMSPSARQHRRR
jgi:hypothetical protein